MKRICATILSIILIIMVSTTTSASSGVTITGVNDSVIEYKKGYEPINFAGQICVPYNVFSSSLSVNSIYNSDAKTLILYNFDHIITFDIVGGVIHDENLNSYRGSAFYRGNVLYVPAETVSQIFGFNISTISAEVDIVRITNDSAKLANDVFKTLAINVINQTNDGGDTTITNPQIPSEGGTSSENEEPNIQINQARTVYPVIKLGNKDIIDQLGTYSAMFLVDLNVLDFSDSLRYAYIYNHQVGIFVSKDTEDVFSYIKEVNQKIFDIVGEKTRFIYFEDTASNYNISESGYIDVNIDIYGFKRSEILKNKKSVIYFSQNQSLKSFVSFCKQNDTNISALNEFNY